MRINSRIIEVAGFKVDVVDFGYASFYYPQFNGNAEFECTSKGFRKLSSYLRFINWMNKYLNNNMGNEHQFNCFL